MIVVYNSNLHLIEFTHFRRAKNIIAMPNKTVEMRIFDSSAGITERLLKI
jgi:hypothetical protein